MSWPARGDSNTNEREQGGYQDHQSYSNVPSSPSLTDPLQPPVRSPMSQNSPRNNYVRSPLNPNAVSNGSRSRPVSWGLDKTVADSTTGRPQGTAGSDGSSGSSGDGRDIALRGVQSGAVGGGLGPYAVSLFNAGVFCLFVVDGLLVLAGARAHPVLSLVPLANPSLVSRPASTPPSFLYVIIRRLRHLPLRLEISYDVWRPPEQHAPHRVLFSALL